MIPTALALAAARAGRACLDDTLHLEQVIERKAAAVGELERLGRTCLQDAVPLRARDGLHASAVAIARTRAALAASLQALLAVPLGATAVGTGIGAPDGYRKRAVRFLAEESALAVEPSPDLFDGLQHADPYLAVSQDLVRVALVASKLAQDLRFLSSGPVGGIGEVRLPALQPGSSIMPGKVNPVMPELVLQVGFEARGAATVVECAVAAGELELNVMEPVIAAHLVPTLRRVGQTLRLFADLCVGGVAWNADVVAANLDGSLAAKVERASTQGYGET